MKKEDKDYSGLIIGSTLAVFLIILVFGVSVTGKAYSQGNVQGIYNHDAQYMLDNLEEVKDDYNSNVQYMPGFAKSLFGDQKISLTVAMDDETIRDVFLNTENAVITDIGDGAHENPTLNVITSENTINQIIDSEDQVSAFKSALKEKEITYASSKLLNKLKLGIVNIFLKFV